MGCFGVCLQAIQDVRGLLFPIPNQYLQDRHYCLTLTPSYPVEVDCRIRHPFAKFMEARSWQQHDPLNYNPPSIIISPCLGLESIMGGFYQQVNIRL